MAGVADDDNWRASSSCLNAGVARTGVTSAGGSSKDELLCSSEGSRGPTSTHEASSARDTSAAKKAPSAASAFAHDLPSDPSAPAKRPEAAADDKDERRFSSRDDARLPSKLDAGLDAAMDMIALACMHPLPEQTEGDEEEASSSGVPEMLASMGTVNLPVGLTTTHLGKPRAPKVTQPFPTVKTGSKRPLSAGAKERTFSFAKAKGSSQASPGSPSGKMSPLPRPPPPPKALGSMTPKTRCIPNPANMKMWEPEEDATMLEALAVHGPRWSKISAQLPGRTEAMCRNRYQRIMAPIKKAGMSHNRCTSCGEFKRGHTCRARLGLSGLPLPGASTAANVSADVSVGAEGHVSLSLSVAAAPSAPLFSAALPKGPSPDEQQMLNVARENAISRADAKNRAVAPPQRSPKIEPQRGADVPRVPATISNVVRKQHLVFERILKARKVACDDGTTKFQYLVRWAGALLILDERHCTPYPTARPQAPHQCMH